MKLFLAAFVAFATVYFVSGAALDPVPSEFGATQGGRIQLGNALKEVVATLVAAVISFLAVNILKVISALKVLSLPDLLAALTGLGTDVSIKNLLTGILKFAGAKAAEIPPLLAPLPTIVASAKVKISKLIDFLKAPLVANLKIIYFGGALTLTGAYLLGFLTDFFVTFLNKLSNP